MDKTKALLFFRIGLKKRTGPLDVADKDNLISRPARIRIGCQKMLPS
jgi:hypothetical protein